jgi:Mg2+/Co2+ transporter CorB
LIGKNFVVTGAMGLLGKQHILAILSEGGRAALIDIDSTQMETKNKWEEGAKTNSILLIKEENVSSLTLLNNRLISIVKTYANSF